MRNKKTKPPIIRVIYVVYPNTIRYKIGTPDPLLRNHLLGYKFVQASTKNYTPYQKIDAKYANTCEKVEKLLNKILANQWNTRIII